MDADEYSGNSRYQRMEDYEYSTSPSETDYVRPGKRRQKFWDIMGLGPREIQTYDPGRFPTLSQRYPDALRMAGGKRAEAKTGFSSFWERVEDEVEFGSLYRVNLRVGLGIGRAVRTVRGGPR